MKDRSKNSIHLVFFLAAGLGGCADHTEAILLQEAEVAANPATVQLVDKIDNISEYHLSNGLKLIVFVDRRSDEVVSQIWYRVGSGDEHSGITGISHMLEHMMFKGTEKYSRQQFTEAIKQSGGSDNAFTSRDYTAYYQKLSSEFLPLSFDLESDRMVNINLREDDLAKEREVVQEERHLRIDDNPSALAVEQLHATAFNDSPYRWPIIGWENDIAQYSLVDLKNWHKKWYVPSNAVLVTAGNVVPEEVAHLVEQYFGGIATGEMPKTKKSVIVPQRGERVAKIYSRAAHPLLFYGFKTPVYDIDQPEEWHPFALYGLASILGGSRSSRLVKHLVYEQSIANSVSAGYDPYTRLNDLFVITASVNQGATLQQVTAAIDEQIARLQNTLISTEELDAMKAQILASVVFQSDSLFYRAYRLGKLEMSSVGWQESLRIRQRLNTITPSRIREVAGLYLRLEQRTTIHLYPQESEMGSRVTQSKVVR